MADEIKRLKCPVCGKKFWTIAQMESHLKKKHGAR